MATTEELLARIDLKPLFLPFYERVWDVIDSLNAEDIQYYVTCGMRTFAEQDALYAKGRTAPGGKVTNAKAGSSAHNYGLAIDACRDGDIVKAGLQPVWKEQAYKALADRAQEKGLEAGFYWKSLMDGPHIQLPLKKHGIALATLKTIYLKEGQGAVFAFLKKFDW